LGLLKQTVRRNSINRIDEIVITPLTNENITKIVGLQLKSVTKCKAQDNSREIRPEGHSKGYTQ
jgi:ATP-dependent Clp protease ATP-binding subunit ClpB